MQLDDAGQTGLGQGVAEQAVGEVKGEAGMVFDDVDQVFQRYQRRPGQIAPAGHGVQGHVEQGKAALDKELAGGQGAHRLVGGQMDGVFEVEGGQTVEPRGHLTPHDRIPGIDQQFDKIDPALDQAGVIEEIRPGKP